MAGVDAWIGWLMVGGHVHVDDLVCCVLCGLGMYVISGCVYCGMGVCMYVYDDGLKPGYV